MRRIAVGGIAIGRYNKSRIRPAPVASFQDSVDEIGIGALLQTIRCILNKGETCIPVICQSLYRCPTGIIEESLN